MAEGHEAGSVITPQMVQHLDACLGCMACVTSCPSDVRYDRLLEDTRGQIERNHRRPFRERALRRVIFATVTQPGRLRLMLAALAVTRALGLQRLAQRGIFGSRAKATAFLAPRAHASQRVRAMPTRFGGRGDHRGRIGLLQGCVQSVLFQRSNLATARVRAAEGFEVIAPAAPSCCGALQLHSGEAEQAAAHARRTITAFEACDYVVATAAGCGSAQKDYGHLLREDDEWAERAHAFSAKVCDATELLARTERRVERQPLPISVAYHDACHLAHAQGIREEPRRLLTEIPGLELREPDDWSTCCGSAGIYNLMRPEAANELGRRKLENLAATGADVVAAANPGCALQIEAQSRQTGKVMPVVHPMELLELSLLGDLGGWRVADFVAGATGKRR